MSTWIIFGVILLASLYVVYKAIFKKSHGCSSCSSCSTKSCHTNFNEYLKLRDK